MSAQINPDGQPADDDSLPTAKEQRRTAVSLLRQLQWLLLLSMLAMIVWLYVLQQNFRQEVQGRWQSNEQVTTRLNEMDDRLFAISQQTAPKQSQPISNQAQNQLDLLRIQLQAANRLLIDDDYQAVISLLRGLQWQLSQPNNDISPALTIVLKQSIEQDIERLQAQSSQPSAWQLQNLAMIDIQTFLRSQVILSAKLPVGNMSSLLSAQQVAAYDVVIHEAIMTLNLAMQASNMRDQTLRRMYLQQTKELLLSLPNVQHNDTSNNSRQNNMQTSPSAATSNQSVAASNADDSNNLATINDVIHWIDKLINNPPTATPLTTSQILADTANP